jgi:Glycosyl hydrolase family 20, catalytic domain
MFKSSPPPPHDSNPSQQLSKGVKRNISFQLLKSKRQNNGFVNRLKLILVMLVVTMTSSILYMFHVLKGSDVLAGDKADGSPLYAALKERAMYSTMIVKQQSPTHSPTVKSLAPPKTNKAKASRLLELAKHSEVSPQRQRQQEEADKRSYEYPPPNPGAITIRDHEKAKQNSQHQEEPNHNPPDSDKKEAATVDYLDKGKRHLAHEGDTLPAPQHHHNKNIFSEREPGNTEHLQNKARNAVHSSKNDPLQKKEHSQKTVDFVKPSDSEYHQTQGKLPIAPPAAQQDRTLQQFEDGTAHQSTLQNHNHQSILDDPKRGGVATTWKEDIDYDSQEADVPDDAQHPNGDVPSGSNVRITRNGQSQIDVLHDIYEQAAHALSSLHLQEQLDPLFVTPVDTPISQLHRIPFEPQVPIGVLVDAGRHYFTISWWKQLIVYLYKLRFTLIQFRLTDDQTFNLQLESYPQLANPVRLKYNTEQKTYTAQEVRELVQFAKRYNISIIPEINIPGHAGGWAGIPGLVIMCSEFICERGYGLPLDVEHPEIKTILRSVLQEVLDIFDNPPYLHLGGDEVNMADPCLNEVGRQALNYSTFENEVKGILRELSYSEDKVIRWERTGQPLSDDRAGEIEHFWETLPTEEVEGDAKPWIVSKGLYFDTNHFDDCMTVYRNTFSANNLKGVRRPAAIIAGTFELGEVYWRQRNVATRLIAVAMGASHSHIVQRFEQVRLFNETCLDLGIDLRWCNLQGGITTKQQDFASTHKKTWTEWKDGICDRLTVEEEQLEIKESKAAKSSLETGSFMSFWEKFGEDPLPLLPLADSKGKAITSLSSLSDHAVPLTGVIFDMVNSMRSSTSDVLELLKTFVAPLGFNLLQLRLVDDFGFGIQLASQGYGIQLGSQSLLGLTMLKDEKKGDFVRVPAAKDYRELVTSARNDLGIQVMPEVSLSSNAGGWLTSGYSSQCPNTLCNQGRGVTNAIYEPEFLAVAYSVLSELRQIFSSSSYFHFGHDNRASASDGCLAEARLSTDAMAAFAEFEEKLTVLAILMGIEPERILRWNNNENMHYADRTGAITHYQADNLGVLPRPRDGENFFTTVDLLSGSPWEIYKRTLALVELKPKGILGEIRDISRETWGRMNVGLRLVAFAMGLQHKADKDLGKDNFINQAIEQCNAHKFEGCEKDDGSHVIFSYEVERSEYKEAMCSDFTSSRVGRVPRKELLHSTTHIRL